MAYKLNPLACKLDYYLAEYELYITSSTQWSKTLAAPVALNNGQTANGCTFFTNADLVSAGTTDYNKYPLQFGIQLNLSGTSGTANINIDGVDYISTFNTDLFTTASDWVVANKTTLNALGIRVFALSTGGIRFAHESDTVLNAITITTLTGDLSGTLIEPFTNAPFALYNHIIVPYTDQLYKNIRIHHTIRTNFEIATGSVQNLNLALFRYSDDSIIGSTITISRNSDTTGNQTVFETYTNDENDPFVTGGFYPALINNSGQSITFIDKAGILIQNTFQKPVLFKE